MAFDFTPERPVLNFGPRHHARWQQRRFVLWPAWAYRVVAPRVRQRKLNLLQRAIMGLCQAGMTRIDAIAEQISVHEDLVGFIVSELADLGYLDQHGLLTVRGSAVLEDDSFETEEMVAGYVFQDPWTGDLWPRFVESLEYCEVEYGENGFPSIVMGTTGRPRRLLAFTVLPRDPVSPVTPSASDIVQAVAQHRKGLRYSDLDEDVEESWSPYVASGVQLRRVSFVEEEPRPVFLMTYVYVPEASANASAMDWFVCDPFGLGQSVRLRRRIETLMTKDRRLFDLVNKLVGETLHTSFEDQQRWLELMQRQAELEIDGLLTVDVRDHPAYRHVLDMESSRQEMRLLGTACPERKVKEVLRAGSKVLEAVFGAIAVTYPLNDVWKRVYSRKIDRKTGKPAGFRPLHEKRIVMETYARAFRSLGFAEPVPEAFLNVTPGQVQAVAKYQSSWRLRPFVTATALVAQQDAAHPLARAAARSPALLHVIDEIAIAGGGAGHANGSAVEPTLAEKHVAKVYDVVSLLLDTVGAGSESSHVIPGGTHG